MGAICSVIIVFVEFAEVGDVLAQYFKDSAFEADGFDEEVGGGEVAIVFDYFFDGAWVGRGVRLRSISRLK